MALSPFLFKEKLTVFKCIGFLSVSVGAFSVLFLKETLLPIQFIGAVVILGGAVLAESFKNGKIKRKAR